MEETTLYNSASCPPFYPLKYHYKYKWWKIINHMALPPPYLTESLSLRRKWMRHLALCVTVGNEWNTVCSKQNLIFSAGLCIYKFLTFIFIIACPPPSPRSKRTGTIISKDRSLNLLLDIRKNDTKCRNFCKRSFLIQSLV